MYKRVIVAIDFSEGTDKVIERAQELVGKDTSKLILTHAVEPVPAVWGMESYAIDPIELQDKILEAARSNLAEVGKKAGIDADNQQVLLGSPADEIKEFSKKQNADAIVIGSHGHSGWKIILGSTAVKVLHGATCDVLTVYVGE